ncbi:MAG: tetratricopeptide repeat protein [Bacteroidota bacterium]
MKKLTKTEIRERFESSKAFNVIFDAFEQAIEQRIDDIELYRILFWNMFLSSDELCLFGEKLSTEFPYLAYDTKMWLATVFAVTYSMFDNFELAITYYKKAAESNRTEAAPYLDAADCYDKDLKIPSIDVLIDFLKQGAAQVADPMPLYTRLLEFYKMLDNDEMVKFYRRKIEENSPPSTESPSA